MWKIQGISSKNINRLLLIVINMAINPSSNKEPEIQVYDFDMRRNLIVNYLPPTWNQNDVKELFDRIGPVSNSKLIRNYTTGQSLGYAFIEYPNKELAANAISEIDGLKLQGKTLKVSYARQSSPDIKQSNVYVAGLPTWVSEEKLLHLFSPFGSVLTHKILKNEDHTSRGVGFVRYGLKSEAENAINTMSGKTLPEASGPLTVKLAIPPASKQNAALGLETIMTTGIGALGVSDRPPNIGSLNVLAPSNQLLVNNRSATPTNNQPYEGSNMNTGVAAVSGITPGIHAPAVSVYVYGLQATHGELTLYELFAPFGAILNVKLIRDLAKHEKPCKGYGFINFAKYEDAYTAVVTMNNVPFEEKTLQVSIKQTKNTPKSPKSPVSTASSTYSNSNITPSYQALYQRQTMLAV